MLVLYLEFSNRSKFTKIVTEIFVIPRNMSFAVQRASLLIHIRFSDYIYSRTPFHNALKHIRQHICI